MRSSFKHTVLFVLLATGAMLSCAVWYLNVYSLKKTAFIPFEDGPEFGVNYYASGRMWLDFWENYSEADVSSDFEKIRMLQLKIVRVFLYQEFFASRQTASIALNRLDHLLSSAQKNDLKVIVTLFDWSKPYTFEIGSSLISANFERGAIDVLKKFENHPAVHSWDLKNEPDHDFVSDGRETVSGWLLNAYRYLKASFPSERFTIGWLWLFQDLEVNSVLDFLCFHHFPEQGSLEDRITRFQREFPEAKIFLGEVGKSTYSALTPSEADVERLEQSQSSFLQEAVVLSLLSRLSGVIFWNLNDHPVAGGPKRPPHENHFGMIRTDGSLKPFARVLTSGVFVQQRQSPTSALRFCVASGGKESRVELENDLNVLSSVTSSHMELQRGFHCFEVNPIAVKLQDFFGFDFAIQYQGLVGIDALTPVPAGVRAL